VAFFHSGGCPTQAFFWLEWGLGCWPRVSTICHSERSEESALADVLSPLSVARTLLSAAFGLEVGFDHSASNANGTTPLKPKDGLSGPPALAGGKIATFLHDLSGIQITGLNAVAPLESVIAGGETYAGVGGAGLNLTERMSKTATRKLLQDIAANGLKDTVINYVEIGGEKYVVNGNNRLMAARTLGITNELRFEKVSLPFRGFKTEADVINSYAAQFQGQ
jgi:hypothetical protein